MRVISNYFLLFSIFSIFILSCNADNIQKEEKHHFSYIGETLFGEKYDSKKFLGKPMIINFWFPSCPPCTYEFEILEKTYQQYNNSIGFLGVMQLGLDTEDDGRKFMTERNISFQSISDNENIINKYDINYFPTTLFLDKNHNVVDSWIGVIDEKNFTEKLKELKLSK